MFIFLFPLSAKDNVDLIVILLEYTTCVCK
jgi:hypothetical protein